MSISQNLSLHLSKKSQPDSDWRLEEPLQTLQMKSNAIDCWLNHWLQMQKKGKRPLVLKDGSGRLSEHLPVMTAKQKGKQIAQYVDSEVSDNVEMLDGDVPHTNGQGPSTPNDNDTVQREVSQTTIYPPSAIAVTSQSSKGK